METSELLKKVRKIEIKTKGLSKHIFSGEYHSAFKGRGMSFSEVREYSYGDDVRNIDWNVTARTGDPHIKIFEEEREMTVMLLVDLSKSSYFGSADQIKKDLMVEIAAVLAFSAISNNDKVGVLFFTDRIEKFIPPKKGKSHILLIIRELLKLEPGGKGTNLGLALEYFNNVLKKRSTCFIISDFIADQYDSPLKIAAKRHDIVGIRMIDPFEKELPKAGLLRAYDAETDTTRWVDTSSKRIRDAYSDWQSKHSERFIQNFRLSGSDTIDIFSNEPYVNALLKFFKKRTR